MRDTSSTFISGQLASERFRRRCEKAREFESISGGGIRLHLKRLWIAPVPYLQYLFFVKAGMSRWFTNTFELFWGRKVRMPLNNYDMFGFSLYGLTEASLTAFFVKNLKPDDVFYDVGANLGYYTFLSAELCKETHAFEPTPELADLLKSNLHTDDQVVLNAVALGATNGTVRFYEMDAPGLNTTLQTVAEGHALRARHITKEITVPIVSLDTYVTDHSKPTVLKIDVEGAEEQVLEGGKDFLTSHAPIVALEIWGKEQQWKLSMKAAEHLRSFGYRSYRLDDKGEAHGVVGDLSALLFPSSPEMFIFQKCEQHKGNAVYG